MSRQSGGVKAREKGEGFPGQRIVVLPRTVVRRAAKHPVLGGLLPSDIGYFPHAVGHRRERPAGAEQAILIHCLAGRGWCRMGGADHPVGAGQLLVISPGRPHAYGAQLPDSWTIAWVHVSGTGVGGLLDELGVSASLPVVAMPADAAIGGLFEEVLATLEQGYAPVQLCYASRALGHLLGRMAWSRHQRSQDVSDARHKVAGSVAFMKQHLARPLRVPALAAMSGLSPSHYATVFREVTGYAPIDYFIRLRMHRACQLLDTTSLAVKEIAAELGYEDPLYFSRAFKAVNEVSPQPYRAQHKG